MPPSYRGGTEEYAYQVARHCSARRPLRIVTTTVRWDGGANALSVGSASIERLPAREVLSRPVVTGRAAWSQLRNAVEGSSAVQLHMPFPRVESRVTRWASRAGIPVVLTYHMDAEFGENPRALKSRFIGGAYRRWSALPSLRRADAIVSNSLGYAKASPILSQFLPKVKVIRQGVDLERLRSNGPAPSGSVPPRSPGVVRILFVGRVVPYKGLPFLIDAVGELAQAGRQTELLIGGRGPQLDELKAQVQRLGLESTVRFLGFVPDAALGPLYADADVVACPSISLLESTPITLQEAMAFGTPVLGTTLPGTEETVPDDGVRGRLVPPRDAHAIATAIVELTSRPRPTGATLARSWADTAEEYLSLFSELELRGRPQ
jgi:rhamnosyl/mannosyltransferase